MATFSLILLAFSAFAGFHCVSSGVCENCYKENAPQSTQCSDNQSLYPLSITVRKFPSLLVVRKGEQFDASVTLQVRKKLPTKFKIDVDLYKKYGFWVKIPCMNSAGSCDYSIDCVKLNCTQYLEMCSKCKVAVDDVTLTIPLDVNFPSFFVNGHYWVGYKILDAADESKVIACGEMYFDMEI